MITLAELFIGPTALSTITRVMLRAHSGLSVGLFYLALGVGGFLSGQIGASAATFRYAPIFAALTGVCAATAVIYPVIRSPLARFGVQRVSAYSASIRAMSAAQTSSSWP
jgi:POT family proton-dependent oligopeptide transporter